MKKEIKKQHTDEDLLKALRLYNEEVEFPTQRKFKASAGLPSSVTYFNRFGSFKNAILLSGIEIPEEKKRYFDRVEYDKDYLLKVFKEQVNISISERGKLINDDEIDENKLLPSASVYYKHFKTLDNLYSLISIDRLKFNNDILEEDMKNKYIELRNILGRTPHSRDFERYSKNNNYWYSSKAYLNHFGSVQNLQKQMGDEYFVLGKGLTKEDGKERFLRLYKELGVIPNDKDLTICPYTPSGNYYKKLYGTRANMLKEFGLKAKSKVLITKNGNKALSGYEYRFLLMLEKYNLNFKKECYYKDFIVGFEKKYRFDFVINIKEDLYFVEIFGIDGNETYDKRTDEKINLCNENKLKIIDIYGSDILGRNTDELYSYLIERINEFNKEE